MTTEERLRRVEAELEAMRPLKVFLPKAQERFEREAHDRKFAAELAAMTALPPKSEEQLAIEAEIPSLERAWEEALERAFAGIPREYGKQGYEIGRMLRAGDPGYADLMETERALQRAKGRVTAFDQARQLASRTGNQTSPIRRVLPTPVVRVFDNVVSALGAGSPRKANGQ